MSELTKEEFEKEFERLRDELAKSLKKLRLQPHPFTIPTLESEISAKKKWKKMKMSELCNK